MVNPDSDEYLAEEPTEQLLQGHSGRLALVLAVAWLSIQFGRNAIPPLLPEISEYLAMTPSQAGIAITATYGVYAALGFVGGRLSDQWSRTTTITIGLSILCVSFASFAVIESYPTFVLAMMMIGVGTGFFYVPARAFLSDLFVERRGAAFGLNDSAGMAGSTLAAGTAVVVLAVATWRTAFLFPVVLLTLAILLLIRWSRESFVIRTASLDVRKTGKRVLLDRKVRLALLPYIMFSFTTQSMFGFLPTLLRVDRDLSPAVASGGFAVIFIAAIVSMPIAGNLGDKLSGFTVAIGALTVGAGGLIGILVAPDPVFIVLSIAVFSFAIWSFPPVIQSYLMKMFPDANMGGDFGAFRALYTGFGSLGPTYVGFVAESVNYVTAFGGLVFGLAVGIVSLLRLRQIERRT